MSLVFVLEGIYGNVYLISHSQATWNVNLWRSPDIHLVLKLSTLPFSFFYLYDSKLFYTYVSLMSKFVDLEEIIDLLKSE